MDILHKVLTKKRQRNVKTNESSMYQDKFVTKLKELQNF